MPKEKALNVCPVCGGQLVQVQKLYAVYKLDSFGTTTSEAQYENTFETARVECNGCNAYWPEMTDNQEGECTADNAETI